MDGPNFDELTRWLAAGASRRAVLQRIVAGVGGGLLSLAGRGTAKGQVCRDVGRRCAQHANCCSGLCDPVSHVCACPSGTVSCRGACATIGGCCIDGQTIAAGTVNPANQCQACLPAISATAWSNRPNGETCDDGNDCTRTDTCQGGACVGANPVPCPQPTECQLSVSCAPETGACTTIVNKNVGAPCGAGPSCTNGAQHAQDTCNGSGTCNPGANTSCGNYVCGATACLTSCSDHEDCIPDAFCNASNQCQSKFGSGAACNDAVECQSGFCCGSPGACCDGPCCANGNCSIDDPDCCIPNCIVNHCGQNDGCDGICTCPDGYQCCENGGLGNPIGCCPTDVGCCHTTCCVFPGVTTVCCPPDPPILPNNFCVIGDDTCPP